MVSSFCYSLVARWLSLFCTFLLSFASDQPDQSSLASLANFKFVLDVAGAMVEL